MLDGEVLQVISEMKGDIHNLCSTDEGWKHINYFSNNCARMAYDQYQKQNLPIGSGKVEGSCKYVVGKRFKGSAMRWKKADNQKVLKARLAKIKLSPTWYIFREAWPRSLSCRSIEWSLHSG